MINKKIEDSKIRPLIDKINEIEDKYGVELCENLLDRLKLKTAQFLDDFSMKSKQSFELYWSRSLDLKNRFEEKGINKKEDIDEETAKKPKFIEEFENKNKN